MKKPNLMLGANFIQNLSLPTGGVFSGELNSGRYVDLTAGGYIDIPIQITKDIVTATVVDWINNKSIYSLDGGPISDFEIDVTTSAQYGPEWYYCSGTGQSSIVSDREIHIEFDMEITGSWIISRIYRPGDYVKDQTLVSGFNRVSYISNGSDTPRMNWQDTGVRKARFKNLEVYAIASVDTQIVYLEAKLGKYTIADIPISPGDFRLENINLGNFAVLNNSKKFTQADIELLEDNPDMLARWATGEVTPLSVTKESTDKYYPMTDPSDIYKAVEMSSSIINNEYFGNGSFQSTAGTTTTNEGNGVFRVINATSTNSSYPRIYMNNTKGSGRQWFGNVTINIEVISGTLSTSTHIYDGSFSVYRRDYYVDREYLAGETYTKVLPNVFTHQTLGSIAIYTDSASGAHELLITFSSEYMDGLQIMPIPSVLNTDKFIRETDSPFGLQESRVELDANGQIVQIYSETEIKFTEPSLAIKTGMYPNISSYSIEYVPTIAGVKLHQIITYHSSGSGEYYLDGVLQTMVAHPDPLVPMILNQDPLFGAGTPGSVEAVSDVFTMTSYVIDSVEAQNRYNAFLALP